MNLLDIKQVSEKVKLGKTAIYGLIKEGHFPPQHPIPHTSSKRWVDTEIEEWIESVRTSSPINYLDAQTTKASA